MSPLLPSACFNLSLIQCLPPMPACSSIVACGSFLRETHTHYCKAWGFTIHEGHTWGLLGWQRTPWEVPSIPCGLSASVHCLPQCSSESLQPTHPNQQPSFLLMEAFTERHTHRAPNPGALQLTWDTSGGFWDGRGFLKMLPALSVVSLHLPSAYLNVPVSLCPTHSTLGPHFGLWGPSARETGTQLQSLRL